MGHRLYGYFLCLMLTLAFAHPLRAAELPVAGAGLSPVAQALTTEGVAGTKVAVGVGYPDLRVRVNLTAQLDLEAKAAFGDGVQVYSGRVLFQVGTVGPLHGLVGTELGLAEFNAVDSISGNGILLEGFVGLEYPFAGRFKVSVDAGPAWLQANASGHSFNSTDVIYNTALYFYVF